MKPLVLTALVPGKPLLLYIVTQEKSLGALLAQTEGKERALYYLSRMMVGAELNYSLIKETCLALIFTVQKLKHYLLAHSTNMISRADPLKYIMSRQLTGDFEVRKEELAPYHEELQRLLDKILNVTLGHVPRAYNSQANTLVGIAASLAHFDARPERIPVCKRWVVPILEKVSGEEEIDLVLVYAIEEEDWCQQFLDYL
ncbi:hypothetical protein H6P81_002644 [Aristolochia fimbriata]|uniref:Reverse transcriptase RNase H-like domain-containing protein n=1 Tax=Aristolochia fimbriata TaxID=158543 RepID=A0AAV7FBI0_ARIFI|nr:hypothetical protein H6P81_002644 [Aristolochia fimbriata]